MNSVEDFVKKWTKREQEDVDTLFKCVKVMRSLIQIRILTKSSMKLILQKHLSNR